MNMASAMKKLLIIFIISFLIYSPSLFGFYSSDDFFHLKISHATNLSQFLNFFNFIQGSSGQLLYRPLTTHVFYFLAWSLFNLNPIGLHIISFLLFFITIYCVYKLVQLLSYEKVALLAAFLYATSATHFGHLYYLATELVLGVFFLPPVIFFIKFIKNRNMWYYFLSVLFFVLALLAKENSVVIPGIFVLVYAHQYFRKEVKINIKQLILFLLPFAAVLIGYLYFHFFYYGFVTGDSYIWDFSLRRTLNTGFWYLLWSFNIPESLVDFVGPGFKLNYNLFVYWGSQVRLILVLFGIQMTIIASVLIKLLKSKDKKNSLSVDRISFFCVLWFVLTLLPVLFLPYHKFTFYLTLPLIAVVFRIAYLLITSKVNNVILLTFLITWTITSILTLKFTYETNWISQGAGVAKRVYDYVNINKENLMGKEICFYDTKEDESIPYSPSGTLKTILSDNNFFDVFYQGKIIARYGEETNKSCQIKIPSRQFLGY